MSVPVNCEYTTRGGELVFSIDRSTSCVSLKLRRMRANHFCTDNRLQVVPDTIQDIMMNMRNFLITNCSMNTRIVILLLLHECTHAVVVRKLAEVYELFYEFTKVFHDYLSSTVWNVLRVYESVPRLFQFRDMKCSTSLRDCSTIIRVPDTKWSTSLWKCSALIGVFHSTRCLDS